MSLEVERASKSLDRCLKSPAFMERFYDLLMASSPEIGAKFASTDLERQRTVVAESIFLMLVSAGRDSGLAHRRLAKLGVRHNRVHLDIRPDLYGLWLDSLMTAVAEFDPEFTPELEGVWRESLAPGIELLTSLY